jgi:hypothetical protein
MGDFPEILKKEREGDTYVNRVGKELNKTWVSLKNDLISTSQSSA